MQQPRCASPTNPAGRGTRRRVPSAAGSPHKPPRSSRTSKRRGVASRTRNRSGIEVPEGAPMLESAEVGHRISKQQYEREEPKLREALLAAQWKLSRTGKGPVLLILSGVEGGGRGETANKLTEWMDPRHIRVVAFGPRTGDELVRP